MKATYTDSNFLEPCLIVGRKYRIKNNPLRKSRNGRLTSTHRNKTSLLTDRIENSYLVIVTYWYASLAYQECLVEPWFLFWREIPIARPNEPIKPSDHHIIAMSGWLIDIAGYQDNRLPWPLTS